MSLIATVTSAITNATQAMKMNITFCHSPIPKKKNVKRDQGGQRDVAAEDDHGRQKGPHPGEAAGQDTQRHAHDQRQGEPDRHAAERHQRVAGQRAVEPQRSELAERLRGLGSSVGLMIRASDLAPPSGTTTAGSTARTDSEAQHDHGQRSPIGRRKTRSAPGLEIRRGIRALLRIPAP